MIPRRGGPQVSLCNRFDFDAFGRLACRSIEDDPGHFASSGDRNVETYVARWLDLELPAGNDMLETSATGDERKAPVRVVDQEAKLAYFRKVGDDQGPRLRCPSRVEERRPRRELRADLEADACRRR